MDKSTTAKTTSENYFSDNEIHLPPIKQSPILFGLPTGRIPRKKKDCDFSFLNKFPPKP